MTRDKRLSSVSSSSANFCIVKLLVKEHLQNPLLVGVLDWMLLLECEDGCVIELAQEQSIVPAIPGAVLRRRCRDGVHCEDFIDPRYDNVINSVIKQSLVQIEYGRRCYLNQPVQQFIYGPPRPAFVAAHSRHIRLQIKRTFVIYQ